MAEFSSLRKLFECEIQKRLVFDPHSRLGIDRKERHFFWPDWKIFGLEKPQPRGIKALKWFEMTLEERKAWLEKKRADGDEALDEDGNAYVFIEERVKAAFPSNWATAFNQVTSDDKQR